jgi:hypothetical protein
MKLITTSVLLLLVFASIASAQTNATPTSKLAWDQENVNSIAEAQALTYRLYADGATTSTILVATCGIGPNFWPMCTTPFPAFTPGAHTLQLTAGNSAGESAKSAVFSFTMLVIPSAPIGVRIQ